MKTLALVAYHIRTVVNSLKEELRGYFFLLAVRLVKIKGFEIICVLVFLVTF